MRFRFSFMCNLTSYISERLDHMLHVVTSIISYDIWFYISHVLLHQPLLYWIHKEHHSNSEPTFLDTYAGHWIETPFQAIGMFVPFVIYTYSYMDITLILTFLNIRGMLRHDPRGSFIVGTHHLIHHKILDCNYGEYWLDILFGTCNGSKRA